MNPAPSKTTLYAIDEIRALMGRHRMSQKRLGETLGMSQPTMSARMRGEVTFNLDELEAVAATFDVPITDLLPPAEDRRSEGRDLRNRWSSTTLVDA